MSAMTTAMDTALALDRVPVFGAVQIALPAATIRLLDGSGVVAFGGNTFTGIDAVYGVLESINTISDGAGDSAPAVSITLIPPNDTAAGTLAAAAMQGSIVNIWLGALDPVTGAAIADPYLLGLYQIDVPTLRAGASGRVLEYECVSIAERLFANDEGIKLNEASHQSYFPGETGFFDVTGVEQTIYWGTQPPASSLTVGGGGGGSGGGGFAEQLSVALQ